MRAGSARLGRATATRGGSGPASVASCICGPPVGPTMTCRWNGILAASSFLAKLWWERGGRAATGMASTAADGQPLLSCCYTTAAASNCPGHPTLHQGSIWPGQQRNPPVRGHQLGVLHFQQLSVVVGRDVHTCPDMHHLGWKEGMACTWMGTRRRCASPLLLQPPHLRLRHHMEQVKHEPAGKEADCILQCAL